MSTTRRTVKDSRPAYVAKLEKARCLRTEMGKTLFRRVALLCEVFEDVDWRDKLEHELGPIDEMKLAAILDKEVDDTGLEFLQLRLVRQAFPRASDWEQRKLFDLYDEAREAKLAGDAENAVPRTRRSVTVKAHEEATQGLARAESRVEFLQAEVARLNAQLADFRKDNRQLREQLQKELGVLEMAG